MIAQAFQARSLTESVVGFSQYLRSYGMNIGVQETKDAMKISALGLLGDRQYFRYALKSIFCLSPEEGKLFDYYFKSYWETNPIDMEERKNHTKVESKLHKKRKASLVMVGLGKSDTSGEEARQVTGANEEEKLKKTDLAHISGMDADKLDEIAQKLCKEMAARVKRNRRAGKLNSQLDLRRTIRRSLTYGGEPMELLYKYKSPKKQRIIVFLDVSGSMDKYSFFLLRFICALKDNFKQLDAFVFSTSLIKITKSLQYSNLDFVMNAISSRAKNWSSGTKIGESFQEFNEKHSKQLLNGSPMVLVLSDGLDTGDSSILGKELQYIERRSKRIVWLNPLKGMKDYQPLAKGMVAALPSIDNFMSAHNLNSLLELENILINA